MKWFSKIKVRKLCLRDALVLASIISKYVDEIDPSIDAVEFVSSVVDKLSPREYLQCLYIMTDVKEKNVNKYISINLLTAFIEGLKLNKIVTLISFWKSLNAE